MKRLAGATYRLALLLAPASFRRAFGAEMLSDFYALLDEQRGLVSKLSAWLRDLSNVTAAAIGQRIRPAGPARRPNGPATPNRPSWRTPIRSLLQELHHIARGLVRRPGFTALAALTLAVGIGATTAIYSLADAVVFQPLAFFESERVVDISRFNARLGFDDSNASYAEFTEWRNQRDLFRYGAVFTRASVDLSGEGDPERISLTTVGDEFFETLGTSALLGRTLTSDDHAVDAPRALNIHEGLWRRRFGADSSVIGRTVRLDGTLYTVVGVVGADGQWPLNTQAWTSLRFGTTPPPWAMRRNNHMWSVVARLNTGVPLEQAEARVSAVTKRMTQDAEDEIERDWDARVVPLVRAVAGPELQLAFAVFLGAVSFVLLIACINVSNLLLTQASLRKQELAVRAALGANRRRLLGHMLGESVLLALLGGAVGVVLAYAAVNWLVALAPADLPRLSDVGPNLAVLGFALFVSMVASVVAGLIPALHASNTDVAETLKDGGRSQGLSAIRTRRVLVVAELAISMVLLVGAGLTVRSFRTIMQVDPGFDVDNRISFTVSLPASRYPGDVSVTQYYADAVERLSSVSGVMSAAVTKTLPLGGGGSQLFRVFLTDGESEPPVGTDHGAMWFEMSPEYVETLGFGIVAGRSFTHRDDATAPPVIMVNETMAKSLAPDRDVLGKRIRSWRDENLYREIVGVVRDVNYLTLARSPRAAVFVPVAQSPRRAMALMVRTEGDPAALLPAVREIMSALDPDVALARVAMLRDVLANSVAPFRFGALLLGVFGMLALALATVGVYGLVSYTVARRTHELGVRLALGAGTSRVRLMVLRQTGTLAVIGVTIGLLGGLAVTRLLSQVLVGVGSIDPLAFLGAAGLLAGSTLVASYVPARRATKVDPVEALRYE